MKMWHWVKDESFDEHGDNTEERDRTVDADPAIKNRLLKKSHLLLKYDSSDLARDLKFSKQ